MALMEWEAIIVNQSSIQSIHQTYLFQIGCKAIFHFLLGKIKEKQIAKHVNSSQNSFLIRPSFSSK